MNSIKELKATLDEVNAKIKKIQEECSHPEPCLEKIPKANTGNWDPSEDSYWYSCYCSLCEKRWTEPQ